MAITNPQIGTGLYSERARGLLGMGISTVAQATTAPTEIISRGIDNNQRSLDALARLSREQVGLLKQQVKLLSSMKGGSWGVGDTVATLFATKFLGKIGAFGSNIGGIIGSSVGGGVSRIAELVKSSFTFSTKGIVTTIGKLTSFLTDGIGGAVSAVTGIFGSFFKSLPTVLESVGKPLQRVLSALTNMTSGAMGLLNTGIFASISKVAGVVTRIGSKFLLPITMIFAAFDGFTGFTNAEKLLGRDNVGIVGKIGSAISSVINGLLLGIPDWISEKLGFKNLNQMLDTAGMKAYEFFTNAIPDMAFSLVQGITDFGKDVLGRVKDYLPSLDSFGSIFDGVTTAVTNVISGIADFVGDAITNVWETVKQSLKNLMSDLISNTLGSLKIGSTRSSLKENDNPVQYDTVMGPRGPVRVPRKISTSAPPAVSVVPPIAGSTISAEPVPTITSDSTGFSTTATPSTASPTSGPKGIIPDSNYDLVKGPHGWIKVPKRRTSMAQTGAQTASTDPNYWPSIDQLTPETPIGTGVSAIGNAAMDEMSKVSRSSMASNAATVKAVTEHLDESDKDKKDKIDALVDLLKGSGQLAYSAMAYFGGVASDMASSVPDAMRVMSGNGVSGNGTSGGFTGNGAATQSPSGRPSGSPTDTALPDGARGKLSPNAVYSEAKKAAIASGLVGTVPPDGAKYGIKTGSAEEWANFITRLSYHESGLDTGNVGDAGQFGGHGSRGLLQLSPDDAPNYGLNGGKPFSYDQLADPKTNLSAGAAIMSSLLRKHGTIEGGLGKYWGPIGKEGWTPGNGRDRGMMYTSDATDAAAIAAKYGPMGNAPRHTTQEPGDTTEFNAALKTGEFSGAGLTTVTLSNGKRVTVNSATAERYRGFLDSAIAAGYNLQSVSGYANRNNVNSPGKPSMHSFGTAVDINPNQNPNRSNVTDIPVNMEAMSYLFGLAPGRKFGDAMHFEAMGKDSWYRYLDKAAKSGQITQEQAELIKTMNESGAKGGFISAILSGRLTKANASTWNGTDVGTPTTPDAANAAALDATRSNNPFLKAVAGATGSAISSYGKGDLSNGASKAALEDVGKTIGTGVAEANAEKPTVPTFTPVPTYDPLSSVRTPVQGSAVTQNPTGAPSYNVPPAPSPREIASLDELSMLLINSSMMA